MASLGTTQATTCDTSTKAAVVISSYPNHHPVPTPNPVQRDASQAERRPLLIDESFFLQIALRRAHAPIKTPAVADCIPRCVDSGEWRARSSLHRGHIAPFQVDALCTAAPSSISAPAKHASTYC
jgi:hypothetical protein